MSVKLLTENHLEFLSLKGGYIGLSESIHVKMLHCWKSHVAAQLCSCMENSISLKRVEKLVYLISGREWTDWSQELRVPGDEIRWQFTSDGSVNGWGWLFTVYPIMPAAAPMDMLSDRTVLSRPSIDLVTCLLGFNLQLNLDKNIVARLAAALAACAQLSSLGKLTISMLGNSALFCRMLIFFQN